MQKDSSFYNGSFYQLKDIADITTSFCQGPNSIAFKLDDAFVRVDQNSVFSFVNNYLRPCLTGSDITIGLEQSRPFMACISTAFKKSPEMTIQYLDKAFGVEQRAPCLEILHGWEHYGKLSGTTEDVPIDSNPNYERLKPTKEFDVGHDSVKYRLNDAFVFSDKKEIVSFAQTYMMPPLTNQEIHFLKGPLLLADYIETSFRKNRGLTVDNLINGFKAERQIKCLNILLAWKNAQYA